MAENEKDCGNFLKGFVIGGVLGALAGIFFAPKSGKELRSDLKEIKKEADRHLSEARQQAKEILARGEKKEAEAGEAEKGVTGEKKA